MTSSTAPGLTVIFGASSDVGRRLTVLLLDKGYAVRAVAKDFNDLDARADRVQGDFGSARELTADAATVVSCAHARFLPGLLSNIPKSAQLICLGSAWRYSRVPNERADQVREAEAVFLASGIRGLMMHPTMIYGGSQERNLQSLLSILRVCPVLPLPGGGKNLVQPIHVDDVAACLLSACTRVWERPQIINIAGPRSLTWRCMAETLARAARLRFVPVSIPLSPSIFITAVLYAASFGRLVHPNVLRRFRENVDFSIHGMTESLSVKPRELDDGVRQMLADQ
ncbi:MAG: NADH-ubiquinone oxidoreductase [Pseudomonadota bacterium]